MDSSESPTYGDQDGSAYNGHFGCTCYHPLFVFSQLGNVERCALRPGDVHSADGWRVVLEPVITRYRGIAKRLYFRGDAAIANPEIYEFLEAEGIGHTIRLPANSVLQNRIGYLLRRPVGRPPHEVRRHHPASPIGRRAGVSHAASWPRSSGIRASCTRASALSSPTWRGRPSVVAFYNQRGTGEQWIKEGKCDQVDAAVAPDVRCQRRAPPAPPFGLQPPQLHAHAGDAQSVGAVVAD